LDKARQNLIKMGKARQSLIKKLYQTSSSSMTLAGIVVLSVLSMDEWGLTLLNSK
jgi:hypothetical protein